MFRRWRVTVEHAGDLIPCRELIRWPLLELPKNDTDNADRADTDVVPRSATASLRRGSSPNRNSGLKDGSHNRRLKRNLFSRAVLRLQPALSSFVSICVDSCRFVVLNTPHPPSFVTTRVDSWFQLPPQPPSFVPIRVHPWFKTAPHLPLFVTIRVDSWFKTATAPRSAPRLPTAANFPPLPDFPTTQCFPPATHPHFLPHLPPLTRDSKSPVNTF